MFYDSITRIFRTLLLIIIWRDNKNYLKVFMIPMVWVDIITGNEGRIRLDLFFIKLGSVKTIDL